jgi:hypothetical protein
MAKKKKGMSKKGEMAIGAGMAALGAGAYYLLGPKSKQHQRKAKALAVKMEKEAEKKLKMARNITEPIYHNVIDAVAEAYSKQYKEHAGDINFVAKKLKGEWKKVKTKTNFVSKKVKKAKKISK